MFVVKFIHHQSTYVRLQTFIYKFQVVTEQGESQPRDCPAAHCLAGAVQTLHSCLVLRSLVKTRRWRSEERQDKIHCAYSGVQLHAYIFLFLLPPLEAVSAPWWLQHCYYYKLFRAPPSHKA